MAESGLLLPGSLAGLALGMVSVRYIATLFYGVMPTAPAMLTLPSLAHCRRSSAQFESIRFKMLRSE